MSKINQCFLKLNKTSSTKIVEEKQKEPEEELSFDDFTMEEEQDKEEQYKEEEQDEEFYGYEEPEPEYEEDQQEQQDQEYINQQKKLGLMCHCGTTNVLREVKKEGVNKGKMFYTCSNSYDEKCDYFMWKDESDKKRGLNVTINIKSHEEQKESEEEYDEKYYKQQQKLGLMCYCKLPSVSREVKKEGANKGKIFYTCSRYFDDKCKYFVWKDEIKK
jgi:hypothetical protein